MPRAGATFGFVRKPRGRESEKEGWDDHEFDRHRCLVGCNTLHRRVSVDIYKYRHAGPKLRFSVQAGVETINMPQYEGKTLIMVKVTNYGDRTTTITNLGCLYFARKWDAVRRTKPDQASIVVTPNSAQPLPYELNAGGIWTGFAIQEPDIEQRARMGFQYMVLYHSHSKRPIRQRVVIEDYVSAKQPA